MNALTRILLGPLADHFVPIVHNGRIYYMALPISQSLGISNITLAMNMLPRNEKTKI